MAQKHLDPRLLERLLQGQISPAEVRELAWHLAEICPDCAQTVELDWATASGAEADPLQASASHRGGACPGAEEAGISLNRVRERLQGTMVLLHQEREAAPALLKELEAHPVERQRILIRNKPRFRTLPVAELLLEEAWSLGFEEPGRAETLAELATEVLDSIGPTPFGEEVLNDLRARSWAYRGNFRRIASDYRGAEEAFQQAVAYQGKGTGDLLEQARLYGLRSTLCRARSRLAEARHLLQKAIQIYLATEETHLAGRSMIELGVVSMREERHDDAIQLLERGVGMVDADAEPRLLLVAQYNIVLCLIKQGRFEDAMSNLPKVRRLTVERASRFDLLRLRWLEGNVLLGLGHEARAEAAYLEVRKEAAEQAAAFELASVSLDLAALYLRQGRHAQIKQLAVEMLPIFQSRDLHQEAIAALLLFRRAVEMENLTLRMIEEVSEVVRRSQGKPSPRNEEPS